MAAQKCDAVAQKCGIVVASEISLVIQSVENRTPQPVFPSQTRKSSDCRRLRQNPAGIRRLRIAACDMVVLEMVLDSRAQAFATVRRLRGNGRSVRRRPSKMNQVEVASDFLQDMASQHGHAISYGKYKMRQTCARHAP